MVVSFVLLDDLVVEDLLLVMYDDIYSSWLPCIFDLINSFLRYVLFPSSFYSFYHLCQSSFLMKFQVKVCNFIKETLSQLVVCKFTEFLRTPFLAEHLCWLLLKIDTSTPDGTQNACFLLNTGLFEKIVTGEALLEKTVRNTVFLEK